MNMPLSDIVLRKTARFTGVLYFIFALLGIFSFAYVQPRLYVVGNTAATAQNMLSQEFLFRIGVAISAATLVLFIVIVLLFYKILQHIDTFLARCMVALVVVSLPVAYMTNALELTALSLFKGKLATSFLTDQARDLGMILLRISGTAAQLLTLYWGLWLFPLGLLVYRSGFIPRIFGLLLLINGAGYLTQSFVYMVFPEALPAAMKLLFPTYFAGEVPLIFWLMFKGTKDEYHSSSQ